MKNCLFISAHYPSKHAKYAGHKTAHKILTDYVTKGYLVDVAVIANADEFQNGCLDQLDNVNIIFEEKLNYLKKISNIIFSRKVFPLKVNTRFSRELMICLSDLKLDYDVLHFEFTHSAAILPKIAPKILPKSRVVLSSHDILTQNSLRSANNIFSSVDAVKTFNFEKYIYRHLDKLIVHNSKDRELAASLFALDKEIIKVISPPLSDFVNKVRSKRHPSKVEDALLFWGAMNREENEEAILAFWQIYSKLIREKKYKLFVVGANPSKRILALQSDVFIVTGYLENPSEYFVRAKIGIVPLLKGAGIKVKTLEMLEAGLPVISTPVGAEGIDGNNRDLVVLPLENFGALLDVL